MASEDYRTAARFAEAELTEKRSRFIAAVKPVASEAEALAFIKERRELYPDARHHVYAYDVLEENGARTRYSDDGEPQGTGGMPVLDVLKKRGIVNAAIVVTRYFGGTLLGAPGLVRAYSGSASACVDAAGSVEMRYCRRYVFAVSYTDSGRVIGALRNHEAEGRLAMADTEFGSRVLVTADIVKNYIGQVLSEITELTASRAEAAEGDFGYRRFEAEQAGKSGGGSRKK
jgi:uncharacterized YigZ family protein